MPIDPALIPLTRQRDRLGKSESQSGSLRVYGLGFHALQSKAYEDIDVRPCDFIRLETSIPIRVVADGDTLTPNLETPPADIGGLGQHFGPYWDLTNGVHGPYNLQPAYSFEAHRRINSLSLTLGDSPLFEAVKHVFPMGARLWIGSGSIAKKPGWGYPINHSFDVLTGDISPVGSFTSDLIRPTLMGDDIAGIDGRFIVPHYTEITSINLWVNWTTVGRIYEFKLFQVDDIGGEFVIYKGAVPSAPLTPHDDLSQMDFSPPLTIWPYNFRATTIGAGTGLKYSLLTSQNVTAVSATFNCRSWL